MNSLMLAMRTHCCSFELVKAARCKRLGGVQGQLLIRVPSLQGHGRCLAIVCLPDLLPCTQPPGMSKSFVSYDNYMLQKCCFLPGCPVCRAMGAAWPSSACQICSRTRSHLARQKALSAMTITCCKSAASCQGAQSAGPWVLPLHHLPARSAPAHAATWHVKKLCQL